MCLFCVFSIFLHTCIYCFMCLEHDFYNNKSAQSNLGRGPRRWECLPWGGLQPACVTKAQSGPCTVGQCAVAFIHEYAHYARNFAACVCFVIEQSLLFCQFLINANVDLETEYIAEKPTNPAFQRYVCQRKCCQVFTYESETFHHQRPNGISHCENGEQNPKTSPSPCMRWTSSNTAMPRPTARTNPNHGSDG